MSIETIETQIQHIQTLLHQEQERGRINDLSALAESERTRRAIKEAWASVQAELAKVGQAIKELPSLPEVKVIGWAQSVLAMSNLCFLELDTTGLSDNDEIVRFTLVNLNEQVLQDFLIKPTHSSLTEEASKHNSITAEMLEAQGIGIHEAWERMQAALRGMFVISYSQDWDVQQLDKAAASHGFSPIMVIGADLQRQATRYYNGEYYLTLPKLAERVGYAIPAPPDQTAIHRAIAQVHVLKGIATAVTDVRPPRPPRSPVDEAHLEQLTSGTIGGDESLGDLDDHPF